VIRGDRVGFRQRLFLDFAVGPVIAHPEAERHGGIADFAFGRKEGFGNGNDVVGLRTGSVNQRQLVVVKGFRVIFALPLAKGHGAFSRKNIGQ